MTGEDRTGSSSYLAGYLKWEKQKKTKQEQLLPCHACLPPPYVLESTTLRGVSHTDQEEIGGEMGTM